MKENENIKHKVETIGIPKLSALSKDDFKSFIGILDFEITEYYKNKFNEKSSDKPP